MQLSTRKIKFKCRPYLDTKVFEDWAEGRIDESTAAVYVSNNNEIAPLLTDEEFIEIAHNCGFWKMGTMPNEMIVAMENYRIRKEEQLHAKGR